MHNKTLPKFNCLLNWPAKDLEIIYHIDIDIYFIRKLSFHHLQGIIEVDKLDFLIQKFISSEKWRSGLNLQSGQRGSMGIIEGGRNPEVPVKVHIFWEGHKI